MKMKKRTFRTVLGLLIGTLTLSALALFAGCAENGKDGANGKDFDLYSVYQQLVELGEFSGTFSQFVDRYLDVDVTQQEGSISQTINSTLPCVVSVWTMCDYSYSYGFGSSGTKPLTVVGSGVIYDMDKEAGNAYIVTNCHVVYDSFASTITSSGIKYSRVSKDVYYEVYLYGLEAAGADGLAGYPDYGVSAQLVGYSMANDIAVLKITNSDTLRNSMATKVTLGDSDRTYVGDDVFAVGNPLGDGISASKGILSMDSYTVELIGADDRTKIAPRAMRVDAIINEGNSGGGLFNADGELIGIVFAKNVEDTVEGMGYALPITNVKGVADSIIDNCDGKTILTKKVKLGITTYPYRSEAVYNKEDNRLTVEQGIIIDQVELLSAASGKFVKGDVIESVSFKGVTKQITREWQVSEFLWQVRPGDTVSFTVNRDGTKIRIDVTFSASNFYTVS